MKEEKTDIAIIGAGPGGYMAALRGAQLGKKIILIEEDRVGGTCTNYGCIPTKFLLHETQILKEARSHARILGNDGLILSWPEVQKAKQAIVDRLVKGIEFLLEKNGIILIKGKARLIDKRRLQVEGNNEIIIEAEKIILAMGSRSADLPFLKVDREKVISSREALELAEIPASMIIVGAGAIGLEFASIFARLGTKVTVLEILPRPLPGCDHQLAERLARLMKRQGIEIQTQMKIEKAEILADKVRLSGLCLKTKLPFSQEAEKVLLAIGRRPNSEIIQEVEASLCDQGGWVKVNEYFETRWPGVYAIGDLIGGKLLAHKAMHEGMLAIENANGACHSLDPSTIPMAVFTDPELASVGLTEEECQERNLKIRVGLFPLQANGRAVAMEKSEGLIKIIANENDKIIGAHLLAPAASEMIGEMALAIRLGLKLEDLGRSIHVHPTLSEALAEASLKAMNRAFHLINE